MQPRKYSALGVLFILALICAACGVQTGGEPTVAPIQPTTVPITPSAVASQPAAAPAPPDTLRWSLEGVSDLPTIDPARAGDLQVSTVISLIFGGLIRLDDTMEVQPDGASSWEVSPDGTTYTFIIREGLTFANGDPVTAEDFVFSINRALAPETASYGAPSRLGAIVGASEVVNGTAEAASGVRALDPRTLEIKLAGPQAYFLSQLAYSHTFVVPKKLVESGADWEQRAYGTGPFTVKEWKPNQSILLTANERYWRGKPGIPNILMIFHQDIEVAYQRYRAGELDIMGNGQNPVPAAHIPEVEGTPDFRSSAQLTTRYIGFNTKKAPFDNLDVRRAFALATDKQSIADQILAGTVVPADRILPAGMLGTQQPIKPLAFDPTAARNLLGQAGFPDGNGLPEITLAYAQESDNGLVVQELQRMWEQNLGVKVQVQVFQDVSAFSASLDTTYYTPTEGLQFYLSVWGADYPDPQNFLSQQFRTGRSNNNGHFSDPQFDRLVDEADQLSDRSQIERRLQLYAQAEQIAIDKVGWLPLFYPKFNILLNPRVEGFSVTPNGLVPPDWTKVRLN
jgi:oligopeptide transport system substrate-binding protein